MSDNISKPELRGSEDSIYKTRFGLKSVLIFSAALAVYYWCGLFDWSSSSLLGIISPLVFVYLFLAIGESIFTLTKDDQVIIKYPLRPFYKEYRIDLREVSAVELDIGAYGGPKIFFYFSNGKRRKMFSSINPSRGDMRQLVSLIAQTGMKIKIWD